MGRSRDEIQADAIAAIEAERVAGRRSTLLQMPTQTGKTRTICKYIRNAIESRNARVLVVAHMGELLNQFGRDLDGMGIPYAVEQAEQRALDVIQSMPSMRVCLASKDSLQKKRLQSWPGDFFTDIVEDECHLATADTWENVHRHFHPAFRIGMTATIDRLDGVPLSKVFESTAYCYSITDAIANGHRCPFKAVPCDVDIDIRGIKANATGQLAPGELEARVGPQLEEIANVVRMHLNRLGVEKAIAFLPNKNLSYAFAQFLSQVDVPARGVDGQSPDRKEIIKSHRDGEFRVLCNAKLLGMGYNDPGIGAVIDLAPTTSRAWFDQKAGRCGATREGKEFGYLLYVGWESDLSLIGPTDIFATNDDAKVRDLARKLSKKAKDANPQDLLEQARQEVAAEAERERVARERKLQYEARKKEVKHSYREYDPIGVAVRHFGMDAETGEFAPVTAKQLERIRGLGLKGIGSVTSSAAAESIIRFWEGHKSSGMITSAQFNVIRRIADPTKALMLTSKEAGRIIGGLQGGEDKGKLRALVDSMTREVSV
ncbi:DEAD/DEAH box helicase [Singulisphaera sp. PoT]|uniref:DEAD/DEAH box helicase n=1 Tax=Singulisphaera sp. PoT TaxID=3411797 RepID=UPI003BF53856